MLALRTNGRVCAEGMEHLGQQTSTSGLVEGEGALFWDAVSRVC